MGTSTGQAAPAVEGGGERGREPGSQEAPTADVLLGTQVVLRVDLWGHYDERGSGQETRGH